MMHHESSLRANGLTSRTLWQILRSGIFALAVLVACAPADDEDAASGTQPPSLFLDSVLWQHGVATGQPAEEFGKIVDAALAPTGDAYILDAALQTVRVFDSTGEYVGDFGSSGRGPGEFAVPRSLALQRDTLYVLDRENGLMLYDVASHGLQYGRTISLRMQASDFCLLNDHIIVGGMTDGSVLHIYNSVGTHLRSFGDPFGPPDSPVIQDIVSSDVRVGCSADGLTVVIAPRLLPEVRGYLLATGELLWSDSIPAFLAIYIQTLPGGKYTMMPHRDGFAENVVLEPLATDFMLLQARRAPSWGAGETISTCIIPVATGACWDTGFRMPLVRAHDDDRALILEDTLFPVVRMMTLRRESTRR